jgi:hypothetical protein
MGYTWIMRGRMRGERGAMWCWVLGAMALLTACTGTHGSGPGGPAGSANAVSTAGAGAPACPDQSGGVSGFVRSPDLGAGTQIVFGRVAVSTSYLQMPVPVTADGSWRYWQKRGILIRAGTGPVLVSVPPSWRHRAAITWGANGIVGSLMLTACRQPPDVWDAYAGGIYLRSITSCVPLVFAIGAKSITVRLSVAGRCS